MVSTTCLTPSLLQVIGFPNTRYGTVIIDSTWYRLLYPKQVSSRSNMSHLLTQFFTCNSYTIYVLWTHTRNSLFSPGNVSVLICHPTTSCYLWDTKWPLDVIWTALWDTKWPLYVIWAALWDTKWPLDEIWTALWDTKWPLDVIWAALWDTKRSLDDIWTALRAISRIYLDFIYRGSLFSIFYNAILP